MIEINNEALIGKLNALGTRTLEEAIGYCKVRGNPRVALPHWLRKILDLPDSDLHRIIRHFELDNAHLDRDLTNALDRLPRGAQGIERIEDDLIYAVLDGWKYGTLYFGEQQIRTGHVLVALLENRNLRRTLRAISPELAGLSADNLGEQFAGICAASPEEGLSAKDGFRAARSAPEGEQQPSASREDANQQALGRFAVDLTKRAAEGEIDPIVGRDDEIRQVVDILMRRRQNNPILTGEAGVGKTAVVEGFAQRIAAGDVPPPLKGVSLRLLDVGLLQAGASMKGEFEDRLRQVIDEVQASPSPIILFIDEAHTLIGAGGSAGTGDAANLLKPALARGTLRTIAATTWGEYKKYIEKDPALTRRFQVVQVAEPTEDRALRMVRSLANTLEKHHRVQVLDEALEAAVRLSHRYIPARHLPDKAVSLLDTASARVAISQHAVPADVEDCRRRIESLETEQAITAREAAVGMDTVKREDRIAQALREEQQRLQVLEQQWHDEKALVDRILALRAQLRGDADPIEGAGSELEQAADAAGPEGDDGDGRTAAGDTSLPGAEQSSNTDSERQDQVNELRRLHQDLSAKQGDAPLILPTVDAQAIAAVVADWTGIPVGRMVKDELAAVLELAETLNRRVIGQRPALDTIARRIQTSRASLADPAKPIGVFMLAGPSGVGKTETGLALAEALYGGEQNVITINMSEFQEKHTVSTLKGSPFGYVDSDEGGRLTEAVRRRPYSIVLLDEIEKAHPDVHEIFFQVFDKGRMEDSRGQSIDFRNTIILLTSNVGADLIAELCQDPDLMPDPEGITKAVKKRMLTAFPEALLNRMVIVPYLPLSDSTLACIIRIQLDRIGSRIARQYEIPFGYDDAVLALIAARCGEVESGARIIDAMLTNTVLPSISRELLTRAIEGPSPTRVQLSVSDGEFQYAFD